MVDLLLREVAAEASEMRSVHFVKSMGLIVDIMNKGNVIRCNTYQYTNWAQFENLGELVKNTIFVA